MKFYFIDIYIYKNIYRNILCKSDIESNIIFVYSKELFWVLIEMCMSVLKDVKYFKINGFFISILSIIIILYVKYDCIIVF